MDKKLEKVYEELKFYIGSKRLKDLLHDTDIDLGEYEKYTPNQLLTIYNIYNKCDKGIYSKRVADILFLIYKIALELDIALVMNPSNKALRDRNMALYNILSIYGIRTRIDLNDIMDKKLYDGCDELPDEERLLKLVKNIIPEKKV